MCCSNSHYLRLLALQPAISGKKYNDARSDARMGDLDGQARAADSQRVQYATILIGASDACTSTVGAMTPTGTFETQFQANRSPSDRDSDVDAELSDRYPPSTPSTTMNCELQDCVRNGRMRW
jgi:hypothetical protein